MIRRTIALLCDFTITSLTISAPIDYIGGAFPITFQAGMMKVTLPVVTNRDIICEDDEYFTATITCDQTPINVETGPDAFVTITDATSKGTIKYTYCIYHQCINKA